MSWWSITWTRLKSDIPSELLERQSEKSAGDVIALVNQSWLLKKWVDDVLLHVLTRSTFSPEPSLPFLGAKTTNKCFRDVIQISEPASTFIWNNKYFDKDSGKKRGYNPRICVSNKCQIIMFILWKINVEPLSSFWKFLFHQTFRKLNSKLIIWIKFTLSLF